MHIDIIRDLRASNLNPEDIDAREAGPPELAATRLGMSPSDPPIAYVIPYRDVKGNFVPFYRVRALNRARRYYQVHDTVNHVYYPKGFVHALDTTNPHNYVIITEGEKKAACATKLGFPSIAFGGVDSWRSRLLVLPEGTQLIPAPGISGDVHARLPDGYLSSLRTIDNAGFAEGFSDFIDIAVERSLTVVVVYDTDEEGIISEEVQRAAARLGFELRYQGIPITKIRQLVLPTTGKGLKTGLDDYIRLRGRDAFQFELDQVLKAETAFPRPRNVRTMMSKRLQKPRMSRKEMIELSLSIITDLDARGRRMHAPASGLYYYFDQQNHNLMPVTLMHRNDVPLHEMPFGRHLYKMYSLSSNDQRIIQWIATQYSGEEPVSEVSPKRVLTRLPKDPDAIAVQLSDSKFAIICGDEDPDKGFRIVDNGQEGVLFEQGQVEAIDLTKLRKEMKRLSRSGTPPMHWADALSEVHFTDQVTQLGEVTLSAGQSRQLAALLFYISPWLTRWRGTQLPVELLIGEAGSGKSSIYTLRQMVITGRPQLTNITADIRDWYASASTAGGLLAMDNVHFTAASKDFRQRLSDELCRIVTEPEPHIQMRRLYTTSALAKFPITATFAITSIEQPFHNTDLLQRAALFELQAVGTDHDSNWVSRHLKEGGGREGWLAHHLEILRRFLVRARFEWDPRYKAAHRLIHYEQVLKLMASVLEVDASWIGKQLARATTQHASESDWAMSGLIDYADESRRQHGVHGVKFTVKDVTSWASSHEHYHANPVLVNPWKLGKYITSHAATIERSSGIVEAGTRANRKAYVIAR